MNHLPIPRPGWLRRLAVTLTACLAVLATTGGALAQGGGALTGVFTVTYGDSGPLLNGPHQTRIRLFDAAGHATALDMDESLAAPYGGIQGLVGKLVEVTVKPPASGSGTPAAVPAGAPSQATVTGIQPLTPSGAALPASMPVTGTVRWANILCKFSDESSFEPQPKSFFDNLFSDPDHGITDFWSKQSYGALNIVADTYPSGGGWYTLPSPRTTYIPGEWADLSLLAQDCTHVADADVDFTQYSGVNLMFNDDLDGFAWGGQEYIAADNAGVRRTTWQPPWGYENPAPISHEIGHGLGLRHSNNSDGDTNPYDNAWDLMSDLWDHCPQYAPPTNPTPCYQRGTNAYHLDYLGWIAPGQKYTASPGVASTITIDALDQQTIAPGDYRMAELDIAPGLFYTVEVRKQEGDYDVRLPGDGVIIYQVEPARTEPAWVIGSWDNSLATITTTGAIFAPGQMFKLPGHYFVRVEAATANGYSVTIGPLTTPPAPLISAPKGLDPSAAPAFQWKPIPSATRYRLQVRQARTLLLDQSFVASAVCASLCSVPVSQTSLAPSLADGRYSFTVTSSNSYITGRTSGPEDFTIDTTPPAAPAALYPKPGALIRKTVLLKLRAVPTAHRYQFAISTNSDCSAPLLTSGAVASVYKPSGLAYGTYYWCGQAGDAAGNWSAYGPPSSFTWSPPIPAAPGLKSPASGVKVASGSPTFTWRAVAAGVTYQLDIAADPSFGSPVDSTTQANTGRAPGAALGIGTYDWHVRALNAIGEPGPWSAAWRVTITASPSPGAVLLGFPLAFWLTIP